MFFSSVLGVTLCKYIYIRRISGFFSYSPIQGMVGENPLNLNNQVESGQGNVLKIYTNIACYYYWLG